MKILFTTNLIRKEIKSMEALVIIGIMLVAVVSFV